MPGGKEQEWIKRAGLALGRVLYDREIQGALRELLSVTAAHPLGKSAQATLEALGRQIDAPHATAAVQGVAGGDLRSTFLSHVLKGLHEWRGSRNGIPSVRIRAHPAS